MDYSIEMARMSIETRRRVVSLHRQGFNLKDIQLRLKEEDILFQKGAIVF